MSAGRHLPARVGDAAARTVHLWFASTANLPALDGMCVPRLSDRDALARIARLTSAQDRVNSVACRLLLRHHLDSLAPTARATATIVTDYEGKPHLHDASGAGVPEFNFSHSGAVAACAIAAQGPVGLDVEPWSRPLPDDLVHDIGGAAELDAACSVTEGDCQRAGLLLWTLKESYLKAVGCGIRGIGTLADLRRIRFDINGNDVRLLSSGPVRDSHHWSFTVLDLSRNHVAAVASATVRAGAETDVLLRDGGPVLEAAARSVGAPARSV